MYFNINNLILSKHFRLINLSTLLNESPDELLYGKVGYLYALLFVNKYISEKKGVPGNHIVNVNGLLSNI